MSRIFIASFLTLALAASSGAFQESGLPPVAMPSALDFEAIANRMTERMRLQQNEKVIFVGQPGRFDPLIRILRRKVAEEGGKDLGVVSTGPVQPVEWSTRFTEGARGLQRGALADYLRAVDLGVMLPGATPADDVYAAIQDVLKQGKGRTIHFHWAGAYSADNQLLEISPEIDAFYQDVILNTDYAALADHQRAFEAAARYRKIRVTTPSGTDISFEIGDRPVTRQDGDASATKVAAAKNLIDREIEIPAGAIRVAPIEESVNGTIVFPDMKWNGVLVQGLHMQFRRGMMNTYSAETHPEAVEAELRNAGAAGRAFREFALGMNPLLAIPGTGSPWIPYYGYGAGVVRLSLGDNTELGGQVDGGYVRWNFFVDATVSVGDEVWVLKGKAVK